MRKHYVLLLICLLLLPACSGDSQANSFLFEVNDGEHVLYLLGSIHVAREDLYPLPEVMDQAFAESEVLVVEVNMANAGETAFDLIWDLGQYPNGDGLSQNVRPETLQRLQALGYEPAIYESMRPWLLVMTIQVMEFMKLGYNPELGVDLHFTKRAAETGLAIEELESVEQQLRMLADMSAEDEDAFLFYSLEQMEHLAAIIDEMNGLWQAGDVDGLSELIFTRLYEPGYEQYYDQLLYTRNQDMAARIDEYLHSGRRAFVIVGAAHLLGDKGILHILREAGYTVTQR